MEEGSGLSDSAQLHNVIAAVPMAIVYVGADERIEAMNALATRRFTPEALGRHYISVFRQPSILDAVEAALRDGVARNTRFLTHDGNREASYSVVCAPLMQGSEVSGILVSFDDVTDIEAAAQMRRDFVANVSHELRTPLTAVLGFIETLKGAARDDQHARERFLSIMEQETGRMNRLVGDLLSLSRVESDERVLPLSEVEIASLLRSVVQALKPIAADSDVELKLDLRDTHLPLRGDEDQLRQVFSNLIENAIKYGGAGKMVEIRAELVERDASLRGSTVRISVTDQGEGIRQEHIARLTERFYRVDNHRSRELGGTGLGLAIVKHILNRHRGRLRIDSAPGRGSTFTVVLKAGPVEAQSEPAS